MLERIGSQRRGTPPAASRRLGVRGLLALVAMLALGGCGTAASGGQGTVTIAGKTLTVYLGQPGGGARSEPAQDVLAAEQLAFRESGGSAGGFTLRLRTLNGHELSDNARTAVADKTAIAYVGELEPGTSEISTEIVNQQGLLSISPVDDAAYLTQVVPGVSNSVDFFYPGHATYQRTFARLVPSSAREADALVKEMQAEHVTSLYMSHDGQRYGKVLAEEVRSAAHAAGLTFAANPASASGAFYGANAATPASRAAAAGFLNRTATANSGIRLFAPSGLYDSAFVATLAPTTQAKLVVASPGFLTGKGPSAPAGLSAFVSAFTAAYHHPPAPSAVFGYEAVKALISVISTAGSGAASRTTVVKAFRALKRTGTAIGDYAISAGDSNLAAFVFAHVRNGTLTPFHAGS